jgi:nicotinic acid mononucleotide adenylyltransferase
VWFLPHLNQDISATDLRAALDRGQIDRELLPAPVSDYIAKTGIYCSVTQERSLR